MAEKIAVIMGDLVSSERSVAPVQVHARFNAAIERGNSRYPRLPSPLTITLGDEFQGIASSLRSAAEIVRELRFSLLADGLDCRFVIGSAELHTPINTERAWNMMGPGLSRAREMLNQKRDTSLYLFSLPGRPVDQINLTAMGAGLTTIERRWTRLQRDIVVASLDNAGVEEIARRRNVAAHSVYKVRSAGQFEAYAMMWAAIDNTLSTIDMDIKW